MTTPFEKYTSKTPHGLLMSTEPFANGNMLSATAQFQFLTGGLNGDLEEGIVDCEIEPGLYSRSPTTLFGYKPENTTIDDYLALACDPDRANDIYAYGRKHWGFFNVTKGLKLKQWLWRFLGFWQHVKLSAGIPLGWLGQRLWAFAIRTAANQPMTNQDGWIQSHLMILVYERGKVPDGGWDSPCSRAISYWLSKKSLKTSSIMTAYIGDPEHPLVTAWERYY